MPISLEDARQRAAAVGYPLVAGAIRESDEWWFFRVRQIGCLGVVVSKRDGALFALGSTWSIDDWLWAYDQGLRHETPFVVTAVHALAKTVEALVAMRVVRDRWWTRRALAQLPASFDALPSLPELRALEHAPFEWRFGERIPAAAPDGEAPETRAVGALPDKT